VSLKEVDFSSCFVRKALRESRDFVRAESSDASSRDSAGACFTSLMYSVTVLVTSIAKLIKQTTDAVKLNGSISLESRDNSKTPFLNGITLKARRFGGR
jgi:hypothetical protein